MLAALAFLLVWAQLAAASHLHGDAHAPGGHAGSTCELCVAHGASAPPPAGPVAVCILPTPIVTPHAQAVPAATPARRTPHAPRAPPFVPAR